MLFFILLNGCQQDNEKIVVPGMGAVLIERASPTELDVYCPSGMCKFTIEGGVNEQVVVNMYYEEGLPFKKIEGAYTADETATQVKIVDQSQFTVVFSQSTHIQVVDYFRK